MKEFLGKQNRRSIRLKDYDYSQEGAYFVTICVKDFACLFGAVVDGVMVLNAVGERARDCWLKIGELHDFVKLESFVVMPNHIHGIIIIENKNVRVGVCQWQTPTEKTIHKIQLPPKGIPSLINHFKGAVKKWANKNKCDFFSWQRNYHEHIIRNDKSLEKIHDYIVHNPERWGEDKFFMR